MAQRANGTPRPTEALTLSAQHLPRSGRHIPSTGRTERLNLSGLQSALWFFSELSISTNIVVLLQHFYSCLRPKRTTVYETGPKNQSTSNSFSK